MKLSRQAILVRDHLLSEKHITSWQAEGVYRIRRLASRVDELVAAGFDVLKEEQQDATKQRYTRYSFSDTQRRSANPIRPPRPRQPRLTHALIRNVMTDLGFYEGDINDLVKALKEKA